MIKEGKFGVQEAVCLITITISSKIFFTSPGFLARFVGSAVWLTTLISNLTAILAFTMIYSLMKRFPNKSLVEIFEDSMGRVCGFIFSLLFAATFLHGAATLMREFTDVMRIYEYPEATSSAIDGVFGLLIIVGAFLGLESLARISKLFAYVLFFGGGVLVVLLSLQNVNLNYLFPVFGHGIKEILLRGVSRSGVYGEVLVLAVIAGSMHGVKEIKKAGFISLILSGIIYVITLLAFNLIFPYQVLQEMTAPFFEMVRLIKYGPFFQRLDPVFLFIWCMSSYITVSVLFYSSLSIFCKMFRLQDRRPIIIPMFIILISLSMITKDFSSLVYGVVQTIRQYVWIIFYGLPTIALITALIRKKKGVPSDA